MADLVPAEILLAPPSSRDGVDAATEESLRAFGAEQIQRAGVLLRLPQLTVVSAAAIFQRFYFRKSFAEVEVWAAAAASVALAGKLEEHVRKLQHVVVVFHRLQMRALEGEDGAPEFAGRPTPGLVVPGPGVEFGSKDYEDLKRDVVKAERHILRELGFEFAFLLDLPHRYVLRYAGALAREGPSELAQKAWNYLNDASRTPLCCSHPPDLIAAAAVFLAARVSGIRLPTPSCWEALDVNIDEVRKVARIIADACRRPRARHVVVPRRKRERQEIPASLETLFPETPAGAAPIGSPDSGEHGEERPENGGGGTVNGHAAVSRQDSVIDAGRVAELMEEPASQLSRRSSAVSEHGAGGGGGCAAEPAAPEQRSSKARDRGRPEREPSGERERDRGGRRRERAAEKPKESQKESQRERGDRGRKREREAEKARDSQKDSQRDRQKDRGKKSQRNKKRSSSSGSSSQPRRRAPEGKGKEKRPRREASPSSSSSSSSRKRQRKRHLARHKIDEEDV